MCVLKKWLFLSWLQSQIVHLFFVFFLIRFFLDLKMAAFARVDDSAMRMAACAPRNVVDPRGAENMAVLARQSDTYGGWMTDLAQGIVEDPLAADATGFRKLWQMLREGESADTIGGFGETPLLRTQGGGGAWTALLLLRFGANPNFRCQMWDELYDGTALHAASKQGNVPMVVALLNAGANPALLDGQGLTPAAAALAVGVSGGGDDGDGPPKNQSVAAAAIARFVLGRNARVDIHAGTLEEAHVAVLAAVQELDTSESKS